MSHRAFRCDTFLTPPAAATGLGKPNSVAFPQPESSPMETQPPTVEQLLAPMTDEEFRRAYPELDLYESAAKKVAASIPLTPEEATVIGALGERYLFAMAYADRLAHTILQVTGSNSPARDAYESLRSQTATPSCDYVEFASQLAALRDRFRLLSKFEDRLAAIFEFAAIGCGIEPTRKK